MATTRQLGFGSTSGDGGSLEHVRALSVERNALLSDHVGVVDKEIAQGDPFECPALAHFVKQWICFHITLGTDPNPPVFPIAFCSSPFWAEGVYFVRANAWLDQE